VEPAPVRTVLEEPVETLARCPVGLDLPPAACYTTVHRLVPAPARTLPGCWNRPRAVPAVEPAYEWVAR
jgi:hypothetical protein